MPPMAVAVKRVPRSTESPLASVLCWSSDSTVTRISPVTPRFFASSRASWAARRRQRSAACFRSFTRSCRSLARTK